MDAPTVAAERLATRFKRWLLAERIERFDGSSGKEHQLPRGEPASMRALAQEPPVAARGEIRREEVPLLARYGTSYGLFDAWIADYACVLTSDTYELGEYVGDSVWVSGSLNGVIGGMPVMRVTCLELLTLKWMR